MKFKTFAITGIFICLGIALFAMTLIGKHDWLALAALLVCNLFCAVILTMMGVGKEWL